MLAVAPDGTPYVAWDEDNGSPEILVKKLSGGSWVEASPGSASGGGISNTRAPIPTIHTSLSRPMARPTSPGRTMAAQTKTLIFTCGA